MFVIEEKGIVQNDCPPAQRHAELEVLYPSQPHWGNCCCCHPMCVTFGTRAGYIRHRFRFGKGSGFLSYSFPSPEAQCLVQLIATVRLSLVFATTVCSHSCSCRSERRESRITFQAWSHTDILDVTRNRRMFHHQE